MSTDAVELKKAVKQLQAATSERDIIDILHRLKKEFTINESILRESKAGLAVGKLRSHAKDEVADLAKELVKKWKTDVDRAKGGKTAKAPVKKLTESVPSTPVTPSAGKFVGGSGDARTAIKDGVKVSHTTDSTRIKCTTLIYDSLAADSNAPSDLILKRAEGVEAAIEEEFEGTNANYKAKIRSLYVNLKDKNNPGLRESIVSGELSVTRIAKMTSAELASEERKAADRQIAADNLHKSLGAEELQAETDAFQCGRCKMRKCRYRQAQTRSADEPMTTFVTCTNCNNRWKFS